MALLETHVRATSEMETTVRVIILVLEVIKRIKEKTDKKLQLQLQPTSVGGHPVFTDLFLIVEDLEEPLLIEVKNGGTVTNIKKDDKPTAQVLQKALIVLNDYKLKKIPFVLTNATIWGIGEGEKPNSKFIRVTSNTVHHLVYPVSDSQDRVLKLLDHLEALMDCQ